MYLNVVQLAESFGVEESVIEGWVRDEGLPHVPERGRLLFHRAQAATSAAQPGPGSKAGVLGPEPPAPAPRGRRRPPARGAGGGAPGGTAGGPPPRGGGKPTPPGPPPPRPPSA